MITKRCYVCGESKPLEEFNRNAAQRDGRDGRCKACERERKRQRRANDPALRERENAARKRRYERLYHEEPDYRERAIARSRAWYQEQVSDPVRADVLRAKRAATMRKRRQQNPAEELARRGTPEWKAKAAVNRAVHRGHIPPVTALRCTDCGSPAQHYHHWSYAPEHRLDVIPLCSRCHGLRHRDDL